MTSFIDRKSVRAGQLLACFALAAMLNAPRMVSGQSDHFSPRPTTPRVNPVPKNERTEAQNKMLGSRPDYNIYTTLAHHPELYSHWTGLGAFLLNGSSLPARQREIIMLRMGWICQAEYEWAQHVRIATTTAGMTADDVRRIAEGPDAPGWNDFERNLLRMVDELRLQGMISDGTWKAMRTQYSDQQMMEALFTAAQYQLVSMVLNSLGVQLDPGLEHRLPRDLPLPPMALPVNLKPLATPRIPPIPQTQWMPEQRELITAHIRPDGSVPGLNAVMLHHPKLYTPRATFALYLKKDTSLPPKTRELLILRTAFLLGVDYEWGHHIEPARAAGWTDHEIARIAAGPDAEGWSEEHRTILQAVDELRREAFINDRTWNILAKHYDTKQLIELVFTVGGYTMTALAINSFGVPGDPGYPGIPKRKKASANSQKTPDGEWTTWGGDAGFTRYSPLDQINKANVATLELAWRWRALPQNSAPDANLKATPLMIGGVIYVPTGVHQVAALDPATGATLWIYTPDPPNMGGRSLMISSRGLAYWTDGNEKRVFHNTLDGRLISINAKTGAADPTFGKNGMVLLKEQLADDRPISYVGSSSPPTVVGDVVIAQVISEITPPNMEATPCHIRGYDVRTGKLLWTFHTIPQAGEFGNDTWEEGSWKYTGNTGVWSMMSADLDLGYIYLPVESPTHDFYGGHRPGNNLFGESLVCLEAATGRRVWHFQIVHHGLWDYDPPAAPILHDITMGGGTIKAVTQLTKQGMSFVFDRVTGEPVWPIEERPVPQSTTAGERASPTQPFPTKPPPYGRLGYHEDDLIDFTPELKAEAVAIAAGYVRGPIYTPPTPVIEGGTQGTWAYPGYGGGSNWNGGAFDPEAGLMFVPTRNWPMNAALTKADPAKTNWNFIRAPTEFIKGPRGLPIIKPPWSVITATDMNEGKHVWSRGIGGASNAIRNHPDLKGLKLDFDNMGQPSVRPSPLVTKSLLFLAEAGNLSGDPGGPMFRAYDKSTGAVVAEIELPAKASGAPMTYFHQGRQYIVIAVATREHPAELVALSLPGTSIAPREVGRTPVQPAPNEISTVTASAEELLAGREVYARSCAACHGSKGEGVSGNTSPLNGLTDLESVKRVIAQGSIKMPPMKTLLTAGEIDQVSRFVVIEIAERVGRKRPELQGP